MVWGCFGSNGVGDITFIEENMNAEMHRKIIRDHLTPSVKKIPMKIFRCAT